MVQKNTGRFDIVTVAAITAEEAKVTTVGGEIRIPWSNGLPDPIPAIGETWFIQCISPTRWKFVNKAVGGIYNVLRYGILVDVSFHAYDERTVIDDIARMGFDQIYLKIASDGVVSWKSDTAKNYDLISEDDRVREFVSRATDKNISVTLVIDCELFPDSQYNQHVYKNGVDVPMQIMSFAATSDIIRGFVEELYVDYGSSTRGIVFTNASFREYGDTNPKQIHFFSEDQDLSYIPSMLGSDAWNAALDNAQKKWLKTISANVGNWPMSCVGASDALFGDGYLGLDCGTFGWSMVGVDFQLQMSSDAASQSKSLEVVSAYTKRLARGAEPISFMNVQEAVGQEDSFDLLNRYDIQTVVLNDYDTLSTLDTNNRNAILSRFGQSRVAPKITTPNVGVMISPDFDELYASKLNDMCSSILEMVPHRLEILTKGEYPSDVAALIVFSIEKWSDDELAPLLAYLSGHPTIIVGLTAVRNETNALRSKYPFDSYFGVISDSTDIYTEYLSSDLFGLGDLIWSIPEQTQGIRFITDTSSVSISQNDVLEDKGGTSPGFITVKDHSAIVGGDPIMSDMLGDQVGHVVVYALRRN